MSNSTLFAVIIIGVGIFGAYKYSQNQKGGSASQNRKPTPVQNAPRQKADDRAEDRARGIGGY